MKKVLIFALGILLLLGFGTFAQAVPYAGVVPDGGPYWGTSQDWVPAWTDTTLGTGQGFILPGGTGDLTLWYGANNANAYGDITPANMYLFSTYNFAADPGFTAADSTIGWVTTNQIDGYKGADGVFDGGYYVWDLPDIGDTYGSDSPWETYDNFKPLPGDQSVADSSYGGNKQFNFLTGTFGDGAVLPNYEWLFLVADLEGDFVFTNGAIGPNGGGTDFVFSPKTTSASTVPEPGSMILLGSGLLGLVGYGRKKFFKK